MRTFKPETISNCCYAGSAWKLTLSAPYWEKLARYFRRERLPKDAAGHVLNIYHFGVHVISSSDSQCLKVQIHSL